MPETTSNAVFLSYASQDAEAAKGLSNALRTAGIEVWFDSEGGLEHGDEWDAKLRRQVKECLLFVPIISATTQARLEGYFRIEWDLAAERARGIASGIPFILPVVIDDTPEPEALVPDRFRSVQWTRLPGGRMTPDVLSRMLKIWSQRTATPAARAPAAARPAAAPPAVGRRRARPFVRTLVIVAIIGAATGWGLRLRSGKGTQAADSVPQAPAPAAPDPRSVAVLAFANMSDDKENEYFSDGISDELLNVLAKIPGLRVAARTSAFYFKGRSATAQEIGQKLGVSNLVEGSVRREGGTVRISASLSRAATGEQLWSESYTRDLKDVFAVQTELAQTIVQHLRQQLGASDPGSQVVEQVQDAERGGTTNAEAYQLYLQGRYAENQLTAESFRRAIEIFQKAVQADPAYASAWAELAASGCLLFGYGGTKAEMDRGYEIARSASDRALALAPDLPAALLAKADLAEFDFDWAASARTTRRVIELAPSHSDAYTQMGFLEQAFGRADQAIENFRKAVALDPVNPQPRMYLAMVLADTHHHAEADKEFVRVIEISPDSAWGHGGRSMNFLIEGRLDEAKREADLSTTQYVKLYQLAEIYWAQGRRKEADDALASLKDTISEVAAYQIAEVYGYRGDRDMAFQWLERARRQRDPGLAWMKIDSVLEGLHGDPRWGAFLAEMGLSDAQVATY